MKKFRILSIDGGGLRGIIPLMILKKIEEQQGKKIHELFDVIIGTSTGGIIACGLTCTKDGINPCLSVDQLIELYTTKASEIFPYDKNFITKSIRLIKSVFKPKYSPKGLDNLLEHYFNDMMLSNTLTPIIVSSYDIKNNEVVMFKTRNAIWSDMYNCKLKDVCRATSAAPTYYPSYSMIFNGKDRILVDGGVYINNPVMAAVSDALRNNKKLNIKNIKCLSLGTGVYSNSLGKKTKKWGLLEWATNISSIMMQSSSMSVEYESNEILNKCLRYQVIIDDKKRKSMDDSRLETINYNINLVTKQIIDDENKMEDLNNFFENN